MADANRPLWQVMQNAYDRQLIASEAVGVDAEDRLCYAAEIRAIADWLVPEEESEDLPLEEQVAWVACRNMRQRLLDEADRAERADCT
jgi:hypothetical protein